MFKQVELPYEFTALEPHIDAQTMQIHYEKHHAGYTSKLNSGLENHPELLTTDIEKLLTNLNSLPQEVQNNVRNNGGGFYNHNLFWLLMTPKHTEPLGELLEAITNQFGNLENFKEQFESAAQTRFGSGWAWLCKNNTNELVITSTANQDNPLSEGLTPILGLDVWEHAYYLHYQNRRPDYISAWWNVVNWEKVNELYLA